MFQIIQFYNISDKQQAMLKITNNPKRILKVLSLLNKNIALFSSLNDEEMSQFNKLRNWWSPVGPMKMLYQYNYHRIKFLKRNLTQEQLRDISMPFKNLKILDVGCGAGFLSESMARLGANVTAIDPNQTSYNQARLHAQKDLSLINLQYKNITIEQFLQNSEYQGTFDIVTSMEVIQHVDQPQLFAQNLSKAIKNGGLMMLSTIARTPYSWITHILAAEYLLKIVPPGTHHHKKFINPNQLKQILNKASVQQIDRLQLQVNWKGQFQNHVGGANYLMMGRKNLQEKSQK